MSDEQPKDYMKLKSFIEAAVTNPRHPVYQLGMSKSPILQHYALHVKSAAFSGGFAIMESDQWFKDYPQHTSKLEQVMAMCEADESAALAETIDYPAKVTELETKITELTDKIAAAPLPAA